MEARRGPSMGALVVGVVLVVVGVVFLLRNAGILWVDWDVLWPVLLLAIGVALIVAAARRRHEGRGSSRVRIPADGAARLELALRIGAGRYRLAAGATALVEVAASGPTIDHRVERSGDLARVRLATATQGWNWGWLASGIDWQVLVAAGTPVALDVQAGAGDVMLDLSGLAVTGMTCGVGAAAVRIVLPRPRGEVPIRIEGGAAQLTFAVPRGVEARVSASGLVTTSGPGETPGYAAAPDRVTVTVTGGAATVRVEPEG